MYKFRTIQHKSIIDILKEEKVYNPNINYSPFINENNELKELYKFIVESFNNVNKSDASGVVFAFAYSDESSIFCFQNIREFYNFMMQKKFAIEALLKRFCNDEYMIFELEYEEDFNPIFIDINDFQFLMPPLIFLPPYTEESYYKIVRNLSIGEITKSELPSNIIQAHLPYIGIDNVVGVYDMFSINER